MFARTLLVLISLVAFARTAAADLRIKSQRWVDVPAMQGADPGPRTLLRAVIAGASPGLRREDVSLQLPDSSFPVKITAMRSVPFLTSDDEMSVVILVQGNVRFMGGAEGEGYLDDIKQVVDTIAHARPGHTRVGLYTYGAKVVEKAPLGPPDAVNGDLLGTHADYAETVDKALQRGLEESLRILSNEPGRRVLFVIGDGSDQREDYSPRHEIDALTAASVEVYVLGGSPREPEGSDRRRLEMLGRLGTYRYANQREQLVQLAGFLVNELNNVYTVEFPDLQVSDGQLLPVDGAEHDFTIKAGADETEPETLRFPGPLACLPGVETVKCICPGKPPTMGPGCVFTKPPGSRVWLWTLLGGTLAAAGVASVLVLRRRDGHDDDATEDEAPVAPPVAPPPAPVVEAARRTQAIRPFVDDDAFPLVGWIVPLNGFAAFQTFRLSDDRTIIGAGTGCDVRINDPLMSGQHAEIVLREGSFILVDRESRNGVKFLDRKVTRHTLIDNDLFTLGETSFKFKCTE